MRLFDLGGKVAIITGSSRGIGRSIAEAYVEAGARVVISSRKQDACAAVADAINSKYGEERAVPLAASISDKLALQNLVDETKRRLGQIDILVCNAATNTHFGASRDVADEQFKKIIENNILGNHWLTSMVTPEMIARRDGSIIIVSSIGGLMGSDVIGAYNISKAANIQLVRNLAVELGVHNVRANAIAPGVIRTDFARAVWDDPKAEAHVRNGTPLGRIGEPHEIAGAAVFLASRAGAYVSGQTIVIDGGSTIKGIL